jgi:hypothetical protein
VQVRCWAVKERLSVDVGYERYVTRGTMERRPRSPTRMRTRLPRDFICSSDAMKRAKVSFDARLEMPL